MTKMRAHVGKGCRVQRVSDEASMYARIAFSNANENAMAVICLNAVGQVLKVVEISTKDEPLGMAEAWATAAQTHSILFACYRPGDSSALVHGISQRVQSVLQMVQHGITVFGLLVVGKEACWLLADE